jgi:broad specificity phosphatase PhoE
VLVRHAAPEVDPDQHPAHWPLSDAGRTGARSLARQRLWRDVTRIFTSVEIKAQETAQILAGPNGITVTAVEDLREVEREQMRWIDDYPRAVAEYLALPNQETHGWESPAAARSRIHACVMDLLAWDAGPVAVVGHGLTLSLLVGALTGADPASMWAVIGLPDVAVLDTGRGAVLWPFGRWRSHPPLARYVPARDQ